MRASLLTGSRRRQRSTAYVSGIWKFCTVLRIGWAGHTETRREGFLFRSSKAARASLIRGEPVKKSLKPLSAPPAKAFSVFINSGRPCKKVTKAVKRTSRQAGFACEVGYARRHPRFGIGRA